MTMCCKGMISKREREKFTDNASENGDDGEIENACEMSADHVANDGHDAFLFAYRDRRQERPAFLSVTRRDVRPFGSFSNRGASLRKAKLNFYESADTFTMVSRNVISDDKYF